MTEDEANRIKGEAVSRLEELRSGRACLMTKAERVRAELGKASAVLRPIVPHHRVDTDLSDSHPEDWPSCQDIKSLREDFAEVEKEIRTLEGRLHEWGALN